MKRFLIFLVALCLVVSCAAKLPPLQGATSPLAGELASKVWTTSGETFKLRYSGEMDIQGRSFTFASFMVLNTSERTAKVAVFAEVGATLFTLEITPDESRVLSSVPGLGAGSPPVRLLIEYVRRIFLTCQPEATDNVFFTNGKTVLTRHDSGGVLENVFESGTDGTVQNVSRKLSENGPLWRIASLGGELYSGLLVPETIELHDAEYGTTLVLRLDGIQ